MSNTDIRIGKVSSVDYENGMLRVVYNDKGQSVTANLPYASLNNEYKMPKVGESVLVAHLSNGSSRGVVVGGYWNKSNKPKESGQGLYRKDLSSTPGEAMYRYDSKTGIYLLKAPTVELEDSNWKTTLNEIMSRLASLDGDTSSRKT